MKTKKPKGSKTLDLDGLVPSLEEDEEAYAGLRERAQAWVHKMGLRLPEQPMKDGQPLQPKVPRDKHGAPNFDSLPLEKLTQLGAELLAYYQYGMTQVGNARIEKTGLTSKLEILEAKLTVLLPPPEASKKARIRTDPRYQKLKRNLDEVDARLALMVPLMDGVDKEMTLVSREITVRTSEIEFTKRDNNMQNRGRKSGIPNGRRVR